MNFYKLIVEYNGSNYYGFQVQPDVKTIQGELLNAIKILSKSDEVKIIGSGRTDTGVHALKQVIKVEMPLNIEPAKLVMAVNTKLPRDIRIISGELCANDFHPTFHAKSKEYNYVFNTKNIESVFARELMANFDFDFDEELMKKACKAFEGVHDFTNYQCVGTDIENTTREILLCELQKCKSTGHWANYADEYYVIRVIGTGFLKQMVRLMVGAIWNVARGKVDYLEIEKSLKEPSVKKLGPTAPPEGLYLVEVHY